MNDNKIIGGKCARCEEFCVLIGTLGKIWGVKAVCCNCSIIPDWVCHRCRKTNPNPNPTIFPLRKQPQVKRRITGK